MNIVAKLTIACGFALVTSIGATSLASDVRTDSHATKDRSVFSLSAILNSTNTWVTNYGLRRY